MRRRGTTSKIRRSRPYGSAREWYGLRDKIVQRDQQCRRCGIEKDLIVHHIIPISKGGRNTESNLMTLCRRCHRTMPGHRHL